jgi:hypothetical protein
MSGRLADRLVAARRRRFVGRSPELAQLQTALTADELPFQVLYIHGPGGLGKTTLLAEFGHLADAAGLPLAHLDARGIEPAPEAFTGALRAATGLGSADSIPDSLASRPGRTLILIDTYEALAPLDDWLRNTFLPQLSENTLVVLACHCATSARRRAALTWPGAACPWKSTRKCSNSPMGIRWRCRW